MSGKNKAILVTSDSSFGDRSGWGRSKAQKAKRIRNKSRVYFIQQGKSGPIKIGCSSRPEKRLVNLQVANPNLLRILGTIPGSEGVESKIQSMFRHLHIQGEWYRPEKELLDFINEVLDN